MPGGSIGNGMMGQLSKMFGGGGAGGGGFGSIANMIGGGGGQQGMMPGGPQGMFPPGPGGQGGFSQIFDKLNIQNLLPTKQGDPNQSIFDMVDNDTFVRKIKKSNYSEIVKKLEGTAEQYTDPDFPPN